MWGVAVLGVSTWWIHTLGCNQDCLISFLKKKSASKAKVKLSIWWSLNFQSHTRRYWHKKNAVLNRPWIRIPWDPIRAIISFNVWNTSLVVLERNYCNFKSTLNFWRRAWKCKIEFAIYHRVQASYYTMDWLLVKTAQQILVILPYPH